MSYNIFPTDKFQKEAKRLVKKFASLKSELAELNVKLLQSPTLGTALGNSTYKIRISVKSKGKGSSGGARVITYVITAEKEIYLLSIYDKSELAAITDRMLRQLVAEVLKTKK